MSKNRIAYGVLLILSLVCISNFGGALPYAFFFVMFSIPFISLIYLLIGRFLIEITEYVDEKTVVAYTPANYSFILCNKSPFRFSSVFVRMHSDYSYTLEFDTKKEYELAAFSEIEVKGKVVCLYKGRYEVGVKEAYVTDFFGLFSFPIKNQNSVDLIVKPRIISLSAPVTIPENATFIRNREARGNTERDIIVRDYVPGDSLRDIHWKASAKENVLKTRLNHGNEKNGIGIVMNFDRCSDKPSEYLPVENRMAEIFLALGRFFTEKAMPYSAMLSDVTDVYNAQSFEAFYDKISAFNFSKNRPVGRRILERSSFVCFIVHLLSAEELEFIEKIADGGVKVSIYEINDEKREITMKNPNIRFYSIDLNMNPAEVL